MKGMAIANKLGLDYDYVRKLLGGLVKRGLLFNDEDGYKAIPRVTSQ
jgi:hypothetical protein